MRLARWFSSSVVLLLPVLLLLGPPAAAGSPFSFQVLTQFSSSSLFTVPLGAGTYAAGLSTSAEASKYIYLPVFDGVDSQYTEASWLVMLRLVGPAGATTDVRVATLTSGSMSFGTGQKTGECPLSGLPNGSLQATVQSAANNRPLTGTLASAQAIQDLSAEWTSLGNPPNVTSSINNPGVLQLQYSGEPVPTGQIGTDGAGPCPPDSATLSLYSFVMEQFPMTVGDILLFSGKISAFAEARIHAFDYTHASGKTQVFHTFLATTEFPEPASFGLLGIGVGCALLVKIGSARRAALRGHRPHP